DRGQVVHHCVPSEYPAADLFSKNADRWCGEGACLWKLNENSTYHDDAGGLLSVSELHKKLGLLSLERPLILQPRIVNHPMLLPISGRGLSTARIVTVRNTKGSIEPALACYRMPVGELVVDNFA